MYIHISLKIFYQLLTHTFVVVFSIIVTLWCSVYPVSGERAHIMIFQAYHHHNFVLQDYSPERTITFIYLI